MRSKEVVCLARKKREDGSASEGSPSIWSCRNQRSNTCCRQTPSGKKKRGRKRSIDKRTERRMKWTVTRLLTSGEKVTRKVKEKCELDVNVRTVQKMLHRIGLKYAKSKKKITPTKKHKGARLECAKRWLTKHVDFKKVTFTDEKRFKFDGPNGWCTWSRWVSLLYWTNDRWEEEELWFGVWSLLMEIYGWSGWKDDRTAKATNSCWTRKPYQG